MNIAQFWDFCTKLRWDDVFLDELEQFLKVHRVRRILDCAGGTGFPILALKQRGWDVTYSDGSQDMHDFFVARLREHKVQIPHRVVNWSRLSAEFEPDFDAVLCRGNALVYINTWDVDRFPGEPKCDIEASLKQFLSVLRPGGLLYVDANFAREERDSRTYVEAFPETMIDGKRVNLTWEITIDRAKRQRCWKATLMVNDCLHEVQRWSYLLERAELVNMMTDVGFRGIAGATIKGEVNDVLVGFKTA